MEKSVIREDISQYDKPKEGVSVVTTPQSAKVLVVDDSRLIRAALVQHLRPHYQVREVEDGEAAWQALLLDPTIQVVISDLDMPGIDGMMLLQKIRSSKVKRINTLPVIINSGSDEEDFRQEALKQGANDFITKDVRAVELMARVDSMLRLSKAQKALEDSRNIIDRTTTFDPTIQMATPHLLDVHLGMMWSYLKRHGGDLSVIHLSLDRTRMGVDGEHAPFIQTLESLIGEMLSRTVRKEDCVARTGNCEFTVACTGIDAGGARAFANRLRANIEALKPMRDERVVKLTASAGVANLGYDKPLSIEELRVIAYERLEDAQAQGGDQVIGGEVTRKAGRTSQGEAELEVDTALEWILTGQEARVLPHLEKLMRKIWPLIKLIEKEQREKQRVTSNDRH